MKSEEMYQELQRTFTSIGLLIKAVVYFLNSLMLTRRYTRVLQMRRRRRFSLTCDCYLNRNMHS